MKIFIYLFLSIALIIAAIVLINKLRVRTALNQFVAINGTVLSYTPPESGALGSGGHALIRLFDGKEQEVYFNHIYPLDSIQVGHIIPLTKNIKTGEIYGSLPPKK